MCDFCDKIYINAEEYKKEYPTNWDEVDALIYDNKGTVNFYVPCDDYYYSGNALWGINYCPYCGEEIKKNG